MRPSVGGVLVDAVVKCFSVGAGAHLGHEVQSLQTEKMCHSLVSRASYHMKRLFAALCLTCHFYLKDDFVLIPSLGFLSPSITSL